MHAMSAEPARAAPRALERSFTAVPDRTLMRCGGRTCPPGTCDHDDGAELRRSAAGGRTVTGVPPVVHEVLAAPGRALDAGVGAQLGARFGHDFSRVRVHTDARAADSAQAVDSLAYTVGSDVVFAAGRYDPFTPAGRRLIAHELAHVVQQAGAGQPSGSGLRVSRPGDHAEHEAAAASVEAAS
jgi:uncharacterized protein DUF4157